MKSEKVNSPEYYKAMVAYDRLSDGVKKVVSKSDFFVGYNESQKEYAKQSQSSPAGAAEGIKCKCPDNIKHGQTSVMCCNHCGLPDEDFWNNCG